MEQFSVRLHESIVKVKTERQNDPTLLQRQSGLKVLVHNSDNTEQKEKVAYLDYLWLWENGGDEGDYVWVRFDANTEERVRVPKTKIDKVEKV